MTFASVHVRSTFALPGVTVSKTGMKAQGIIGTIVADAAETESPASFVAATVNVYLVPFVSSRTVHVSAPAAGVHVLPSGVDVTVYFEIVRPPLSVGAVHEIAISPFAATPVGVPGAEEIAPALNVFAVDDAPPPAEFVAATVIEYDVPTVRPVSLHEVAGAVAEQLTDVSPVAAAVAVYDVIAAPPSESGASHETFISVRAVRVTATFLGTLGTHTDGHALSRRFGLFVSAGFREY